MSHNVVRLLCLNSTKILQLAALRCTYSVPKSALFNQPNKSGLTNVRYRASYYQDKGIRKAIRRFFVRYPRSPLFIALGILLSVFFSPVYTFSKVYRSKSKDEFIDYRNKHNAVVYERLKFGSHLYFPFLSKNIARDQNDETQSIYAQSDLPPSRTSIY